MRSKTEKNIICINCIIHISYILYILYILYVLYIQLLVSIQCLRTCLRTRTCMRTRLRTQPQRAAESGAAAMDAERSSLFNTWRRRAAARTPPRRLAERVVENVHVIERGDKDVKSKYLKYKNYKKDKLRLMEFKYITK